METQSSLEEQLRVLEERLLQPEVRRSAEALGDLLADEFVEFGSSGRVFSKQDAVEGLPHAPTVRITLSDFKATLLAPGVALATYRAVKHDEPKAEMKHSLRSSIWKLLDGRWQVVFHQGTPTAAP
ncbi:MAG TPA: DUF4440 domain-containing protein [Phycisphaerae bacterium]|nr:DUF4440 domain-containing protein [Phycisphaerae bacterium]